MVVLANVLLSHYAKAVEIVVSTNVSTQTHSQHETTPQPIPFSPSLPDITTKPPTKAYSARSYTLFFVQDVSPIGGGDFIKYKYVLALVDRDIKMPLCYVTLENSAVASNVLCVFENDGSHKNYGSLSGQNLMQEFLKCAFNQVNNRFRLGRVEEMVDCSKQRSQEQNREETSHSGWNQDTVRKWGIGTLAIALWCGIIFIFLFLAQPIYGKWIDEWSKQHQPVEQHHIPSTPQDWQKMYDACLEGVKPVAQQQNLPPTFAPAYCTCVRDSAKTLPRAEWDKPFPADIRERCINLAKNRGTR